MVLSHVKGYFCRHASKHSTRWMHKVTAVLWNMHKLKSRSDLEQVQFRQTDLVTNAENQIQQTCRIHKHDPDGYI